jgi:diacylglycerol kinase (ATP)
LRQSYRGAGRVKTIVIFNPYSGRGRGGAIASAVERGLLKRGLEVELHATGRPKDAMRIARSFVSTADIIVAVGGDGTINEVANGMACGPLAMEDVALADTAVGAVGPARLPSSDDSSAGAGECGGKAALGIVPAGTVNVLALELELPFQVERACNVIAAGKTVSLDLGRVNERRFALMMGAGIDALTVRNVEPRAKKRYRELAFFTTGLKAGLAERAPAFLVRANGEEYLTTFFVAGNSRYYAGRLRVTPDADPTDGLLDLMLFTGTTRSSLAVFWMGVPSGLHLRNPNVTYLRAERAELTLVKDKDTVWYQTDGELAGRLPATLEIDPQALDVLVP